MAKPLKGTQAVPVTIVSARKRSNAVTRLGTPAAFIMLLGLLLLYYAVRGWDVKYGTFNGSFAGKGNVPSGTKKASDVARIANPDTKLA